MFLTRASAIAAFAAVLLAANANANSINNGDFETGTFSSWTTYSTTGGGLSWSATKDPIGVYLFDVDGNGASDLAGRFRPGQVVTYQSGVWAGGGISQSFASGAGLFSLGLDLAFYEDPSATTPSSAAGRYQIFVDNALLGGWTLASISNGATVRNHLDLSGLLTEGSHELKIEMTRQYLTGSTPATLTPLFFVDNVVLDAPVVSVPEPTSMLMMLAGIGIMGGIARKRLAS